VRALRRHLGAAEAREGRGVKRASLAERHHMEAVASIGCVLCRHLGAPQQSATSLHHVKEGQGLSQRAEHWLTVPLCFDHHQGPNGLHGLGTKGFYTRYKLDEMDLLAFTIEWLSLARAVVK
jgi:hypothetical protein